MAVYDRPIANLMLNSKKLQALGSWKRQECPFSPLLFNIGAEIPVRSMSKKRKRKKRIIRCPNCLQMTWYYIQKIPKDSTRKLLELIKDYSKVAGYKINTQKSIAFLYTNNEKTEREIKETIPFTVATERIKYLEIYLPKETKDLYIENYKTLVKEIKEGTKNGEIYHVHGLEESI